MILMSLTPEKKYWVGVTLVIIGVPLIVVLFIGIPLIGVGLNLMSSGRHELCIQREQARLRDLDR